MKYFKKIKPIDYNSIRATFRQVKDALGLVEDIENFDKEYAILERIGQGFFKTFFSFHKFLKKKTI